MLHLYSLYCEVIFIRISYTRNKSSEFQFRKGINIACILQQNKYIIIFVSCFHLVQSNCVDFTFCSCRDDTLSNRYQLLSTIFSSAVIQQLNRSSVFQTCSSGFPPVHTWLYVFVRQCVVPPIRQQPSRNWNTHILYITGIKQTNKISAIIAFIYRLENMY